MSSLARPALRVPRPAAVAAGLVAVLLLAGCSDDPELSADQKAAETTSRTFLQAIVDEDAEAACEVMAFADTAVKSDPTLMEPCITGIEESPTPQRRRNVFTALLKDDPVVGPAKDGRINVTWGKGSDAVEHAVVKVGDDWLLTQ